MRHQNCKDETLCSSIIFYFKLSLREPLYHSTEKSKPTQKGKTQKFVFLVPVTEYFLFGLDIYLITEF